MKLIAGIMSVLWLMTPVLFAENSAWIVPAESWEIRDAYLPHLIPEVFYLESDGQIYRYNPHGKKHEVFYKVNLDEDAAQEIVIRFLAYSDSSICREIVMIVDDLKKYFVGLSTYPDEVGFHDLDGDGDQELVFFSRSSTYYTNIYVFDYKPAASPEKGVVELFREGSSLGIRFEAREGESVIKIARINPQNKVASARDDELFWEVYVWDGKGFVRQEPEGVESKEEEGKKEPEVMDTTAKDKVLESILKGIPKARETKTEEETVPSGKKEAPPSRASKEVYDLRTMERRPVPGQ